MEWARGYLYRLVSFDVAPGAEVTFAGLRQLVTIGADFPNIDFSVSMPRGSQPFWNFQHGNVSFCFREVP